MKRSNAAGRSPSSATPTQVRPPLSLIHILLENGYVTGRPYLGISYYAVTDAQTAAQLGVNAYGVYIVEVVKGCLLYTSNALRVALRIS